MAALIQPFNANNYNPEQSAGGLPVGRHPVIIESSDVKATKAGDGGFLELILKITDGPQVGQTGAYRLNLYNASQQAVDIANRQMSAISHVTGVFQIQDSAQLHNIPFVIEVAPQKNDPQYTEVKKVFDINGNEPGKQGQGGGAAQTQGQGNGGFGGAAQGGGQQQDPNQGQNQGGGQAGGWGGQQDQNQGGNQGGGGFQPPQNQGGGQQQQPPANGGGAWGGGAQDQGQGQGGGFQPPAGQGQAQGGGQQQGNGGGWQQNGGGAAQGGAGGPWGGGQG